MKEVRNCLRLQGGHKKFSGRIVLGTPYAKVALQGILSPAGMGLPLYPPESSPQGAWPQCKLDSESSGAADGNTSQPCSLSRVSYGRSQWIMVCELEVAQIT